MPEEQYISIGEASQLLGVSEAALRQWTDEGKIKAFVTPGGHRRFSRAEIKRFMTSVPRMVGARDLAAGLEETAPAHREIARALLSNTTWYERLGKESQERLSELGRRQLGLIIRYVTTASRREETVLAARQVGEELGETLASAGIPLTDSVEAFLLHREPIMNTVAQLVKKHEAVDGRVIRAIPSLAHVMDETLVSLVSAHQRHRNGLQKPDGGPTP